MGLLRNHVMAPWLRGPPRGHNLHPINGGIRGTAWTVRSAAFGFAKMFARLVHDRRERLRRVAADMKLHRIADSQLVASETVP